ncbi:hypothetical protein AYO44_00890 [Planctomycetaceae bacterium SCGC AG-212-F19]|nr:hypothetical protein AYO44_00890 [Planctomycetaceae bacterium SCGC AG-212-F19]
MRPMHVILLSAAIALSTGLAAAQEKLPSTWDGPLCKPVDRETVYEFAREPAVHKVGPDRYEITFAAKARCDVAVAIEDASGAIVRHIVYGVLGANAPAPLKKDALEQTITWDGKDEFGKYVKNPEQCRVRVSLGLKPTFDKIIGWHPKDMTEWRRTHAIAAAADGVYVLECPPFGHPTLRRYDHDANYIETVYPWDPDKLDRIGIPMRTVPDAKIWRDTRAPAGSRQVPVLTHYGATAPFGELDHSLTCIAVAAGKIGVFTDGGKGPARRLLRLRTDGTTGGEPIEGGLFTPRNTAVPSFAGQAHIALSPDGKWVYVTGLGRATAGFGNKRDMREEKPPYTWNAVFRFGWDETGVVVEGRDSFTGELSRDAKTCGAGNDNEHLNAPQGLACDAAGRLYVADCGNNRIQVFSPERKHLQTISVKEPQEIAIHPKTGDIYVLCFRRNNFSGVENKEAITLIKFGPLDNPAELMRHTFTAVIPGDPREFGYPVPLLAVDGWGTETRVWLVHESGVVRVFAERGKKWELYDDFEADVRKAGHTPFCMHGKKMGYINADPVRGHVYRISTRTQRKRRIDPDEGKTWQEVDMGRLPHGGPSDGSGVSVEEAVFGWNGLLYVRTLKYIARFNPDKFPASGPIVLGSEQEVPFDYGEQKHAPNRKGEESARLQGIIGVSWAMGGPNGYNNGLGVSPRGDIMILTENYRNLADLIGEQKRNGSQNVEGAFDNIERRGKEDLKDPNRYRPAIFAGRLSNSNLVCRWNAKGELQDMDTLPGLSICAFGLRTDREGNLYVGTGEHQNVDSKPHFGGTLAKFAGKGARILSEPAAVKLEQIPNRPPDFMGGGVGRAWAQNMFWSAPGLDQIAFVDPIGGNYPCGCYHSKFDTDPYGRCFMPRASFYHVLVVDTNGNRICEIGRFGNADKPAMKPGDTDIGLGQCSYISTVSDKWLYIGDDSNMRIIRVKLGYHAEKRVTIARQS